MRFKKVEKERKKFEIRRDIFTIISFFVLLVGLIFFVFNIYLDKFNPTDNFFLYFGIALIILAILIFALGLADTDEYKKILISIQKKAIKEIYPEYSKFNNKSFKIELFNDNLILQKPLYYSFDKSFDGKINSILFHYASFNFRYAQVLTDKYTSNISSAPIDGNIIIFELNGNNIFNDNEMQNPILYIRLSKKVNEDKVSLNDVLAEKILYESQDFNEKFECFSNDKLFAFKALSPKAIIGLLNFYNVFKDKKIPANSYNNFSIVFNKNKIFVFLKIHPLIYGFNVNKEFNESEYSRIKKEFELPRDFFNALDLYK